MHLVVLKSMEIMTTSIFLISKTNFNDVSFFKNTENYIAVLWFIMSANSRVHKMFEKWNQPKIVWCKRKPSEKKFKKIF